MKNIKNFLKKYNDVYHFNLVPEISGTKQAKAFRVLKGGLFFYFDK